MCFTTNSSKYFATVPDSGTNVLSSLIADNGNRNEIDLVFSFFILLAPLIINLLYK